VSVAGVRAEEVVMVSSSEPGPPVNGRPVRPADDWRLGPERIAELLAVAEAANMALLVLEAAARSARDDLESVLRSVDAIDQQKRAAGGAAHALDEAGDRAARHLRTVDRLTEAASRSVGAALEESGAHASEAALEQLDSWADLSRIETEGLHQYRRDRWGLANALESLNDLRETEARRLQELIERRAGLMSSLTEMLTKQADAARSITDAG
jgi:DNA repair exonuclease SbcCD ATPase subunit